MFLFEDYINNELVLKNPDKIFVFDDNLNRYGKSGQSIIRDCPNAHGIATKRKPSMEPDAFFSDKRKEYNQVKKDIRVIYNAHNDGKVIVLPTNRIGSGRAKLKENAPKIWKLIDTLYTYAEYNLSNSRLNRY